MGSARRLILGRSPPIYWYEQGEIGSKSGGNMIEPLLPQRLQSANRTLVFWLSTTLALLFLVTVYGRSSSRLDIFRALSLGLPRTEALQILKRNEIGCGILSTSEAQLPRECWFWDPWRTYGIVFEPGENGRIMTRGYTYRNQSARLSGTIRRLVQR